MEEFVRQHIFPWTILRPRGGGGPGGAQWKRPGDVAQAYPGCRFVDLCYPERDPDLGGLTGAPSSWCLHRWRGNGGWWD